MICMVHLNVTCGTYSARWANELFIPFQKVIRENESSHVYCISKRYLIRSLEPPSDALEVYIHVKSSIVVKYSTRLHVHMIDVM